MNRRLIGIIAGVSVLGLGVPALANARDGGDGTPEDNGVSGDVRGNCDEAEHANDPECLGADPSTTTIVVTTTIEEDPTTTVEETTTTTSRGARHPPCHHRGHRPRHDTGHHRRRR